MSNKRRSNKPVNYEELVTGYEFTPVSYELGITLVSKYVEAVDSHADKFVPPLAIAACAMTALTGSLSLPAGVIHASQEFKFFKLVPVGATVSCQSRVARKITRSSMDMLVLELDVFNEDNEKVQSGKATIVLPAEGTNA